jgi:hypothetical protein
MESWGGTEEPWLSRDDGTLCALAAVEPSSKDQQQSSACEMENGERRFGWCELNANTETKKSKPKQQNRDLTSETKTRRALLRNHDRTGTENSKAEQTRASQIGAKDRTKNPSAGKRAEPCSRWTVHVRC